MHRRAGALCFVGAVNDHNDRRFRHVGGGSDELHQRIFRAPDYILLSIHRFAGLKHKFNLFKVRLYLCARDAKPFGRADRFSR